MLDWRGDQFLKLIAAEIRARRYRAAQYLVTAIRRRINRPNPDGKNPSETGEPPKLVTQKLFNSIQIFNGDAPAANVTVDDSIAVGSDMPYAERLELGDSQFPARPYLLSTFLQEQETLRHILEIPSDASLTAEPESPGGSVVSRVRSALGSAVGRVTGFFRRGR
jgi:hypothetical protein